MPHHGLVKWLFSHFVLLHSSLLSQVVRWLFSATTCEHEPPVKLGGALFAPTASSDSKSRCHSLDDTPDADVFIEDESWNAYPVWGAFCLDVFSFLFFHNLTSVLLR